MKPSDALRAHRDEVKAIIGQHHAGNVRVFGSVLHHDDTEASDLDLLVDTTQDDGYRVNTTETAQTSGR